MEETEQTTSVSTETGHASRRDRRRLATTIWEWARAATVALVLFLLVRTFVVEAFKIPSSSMENTLLVGDFLLVNKAIYGAEIPGIHLHLPAFEEPKRGDVIVFVPPMDPTKDYVKRLVGLPGDTLQMEDTRLYVDGSLVNEPYARYVTRHVDVVRPEMRWQSSHLLAGPRGSYHPSRDTWGPLVVPPGDYFVLGDNRDNSDDSRYWGFVPRDAIRGRPWLVYYSYDPDTSGRVPWLFGIRWSRIGTRIR